MLWGPPAGTCFPLEPPVPQLKGELPEPCSHARVRVADGKFSHALARSALFRQTKAATGGSGGNICKSAYYGKLA